MKIARSYLLIMTIGFTGFLNSNLVGQENPTIYNLVLEGGGMKGLAYPGAFLELEKAGALDSIRRIAGTSSGSLNGAMLALGYTPQQILHISMNTNYKKFNKAGFPVIQPIFRMRKKFGFYSSERLLKAIEDLVENRTGDANFTFKQLYDTAQLDPAFKELFVTGTCLNQKKIIIFSHKTFPDMPIANAVRISSTLPFHFETIFMQPDGTIVSHKNITDSTLYMVDGGLMMNYPIHVFDTLVDYGQCEEYLPNQNTLGLRLDQFEQIEKDMQLDSKGLGYDNEPISGISPYFKAMYEISFEKLNRMSLTPADWKRTISIDSKNIQTKVRNLSDQEKNMLVQSGRLAVIRYFSN